MSADSVCRQPVRTVLSVFNPTLTTHNVSRLSLSPASTDSPVSVQPDTDDTQCQQTQSVASQYGQSCQCSTRHSPVPSTAAAAHVSRCLSNSQQTPLDVQHHSTPLHPTPRPHHIEMIALILRSNPDQFHQKFVAAKIQITSYTQQKPRCGCNGHRAVRGAFLRHGRHE